MSKKFIYVTFFMSLCLLSFFVVAEEEIEQVEKQGAEPPPSALEPDRPVLEPALAPTSSKLHCIRGVFILCERGLSGKPEAKLFTSKTQAVRVSRVGPCKVARVAGERLQSVKNFNHAKLWPITSQNFSGLQYYQELLWICTTGQVLVRIGSNVVYSCRKNFEAHTVSFGMCI